MHYRLTAGVVHHNMNMLRYSLFCHLVTLFTICLQASKQVKEQSGSSFLMVTQDACVQYGFQQLTVQSVQTDPSH